MKSFWILISLGLWLAVGAFVSAFLIKERALSSINQLIRTDTPSSAMQTSSALADIQMWLRLSHLLRGRGLSYSPTWITTTVHVLEKIVNSGALPTEDLSFTCTECNATLKSHLKIVSELAHMGKIKELAYERIIDMQEEFKLTKSTQIKLHSLLAKDFADLIGSTPLYQSKGESELIYYEDGPFKWLPRLDGSSRSGVAGNSQAIDDLSEKIENLKSQSQVIIEAYQTAATKIERSIQAISTLERDRSEIRLKMKRLLLDGIKEEAMISLYSFWVAP